MPQIYDVLIVGAGPAGLVLAEQLAQAGAAVAVLDKKPAIGIRPIRCGEAFGPARDWPSEIPFDSCWVESEIRSVIVESPAGTQYNLSRPDLGWAIDRSMFENKLAQRAAAKGAKLFTDCYAKAARFDGNWTIDCLQNGRTVFYSARFLVGADGVESRVAYWTHIRNKRKPLEVCTTAQVHYRLTGYERDALRFYVGPRFAPNGYAWVFPGVENKHNIGIGVLTNPGRPRLDVLLREFLIQARIEVPAREAFVYGAIPIGGFDRNPVGRASLLVGDAAGLAYPLSGGGILNALHSGLMAAQAVNGWLGGNKSALAQYPKDLRKRFYWNFKRELWARRLLFSCSDRQIENLMQRTRTALPKDRSSMSEARAVLCLLKAGIPFLARKLISGLFLLLFVLAPMTYAARPDSAKMEALQAALLTGERQEYDSSRALFDDYLRQNPEDILALLLRASIEGLRIIDYEDNRSAKTFEADLQRILALAETSRATREYDSAWIAYFQGAALATLGSHLLRSGEYWQGCRLGIKALDALGLVKTQEAPRADCFLYQGIFDYAKGELEKKLKLILFWRDAGGKKEGIRKLELCRTHSLFSRTAAAQTLLGIYVREKEWAKSAELYRDILSKFPQNRPARWTLANGYFETRQYAKAAPVYGELLNLLEGVRGLASWQLALCQYRLAVCAAEAGDTVTSRRLGRLVLEHPEKDHKMKDIQKDARRLLNRTS